MVNIFISCREVHSEAERVGIEIDDSPEIVDLHLRQ